jgi:hypothetical protein
MVGFLDAVLYEVVDQRCTQRIVLRAGAQRADRRCHERDSRRNRTVNRQEKLRKELAEPTVLPEARGGRVQQDNGEVNLAPEQFPVSPPHGVTTPPGIFL